VGEKGEVGVSGAIPSPVYGRRWLREAESDEGRRGWVGTMLIRLVATVL
jgi:hypothetical protein